MNSEKMKENVLRELTGNPNPDPLNITRSVVDRSKVEDGLPEIKQMIKILQEKYPNIANQIPETIKNWICATLKSGMSLKDTWDFFKVSNPNLTLDQIKNLKCGKYIKLSLIT